MHSLRHLMFEWKITLVQRIHCTLLPPCMILNASWALLMHYAKLTKCIESSASFLKLINISEEEWEKKFTSKEERMLHEGEKKFTSKIWGISHEEYFNNIQYPCGTTPYLFETIITSKSHHKQEGKMHQTMSS